MASRGVKQPRATIPHLLQTLTLRHSVQHISNDASLAVIAGPAVIFHLLAQELKARGLFHNQEKPTFHVVLGMRSPQTLAAGVMA
jgi:hypothetical protein